MRPSRPAPTPRSGILDRRPSAVRQLAHRAREHVHARRPRYQTDPQVRQQVTERFLAAVVGGDLNALMQVLAPDVTMWPMEEARRGPRACGWSTAGKRSRA